MFSFVHPPLMIPIKPTPWHRFLKNLTWCRNQQRSARKKNYSDFVKIWWSWLRKKWESNVCIFFKSSFWSWSSNCLYVGYSGSTGTRAGPRPKLTVYGWLYRILVVMRSVITLRIPTHAVLKKNRYKIKIKINGNW